MLGVYEGEILKFEENYEKRRRVFKTASGERSGKSQTPQPRNPTKPKNQTPPTPPPTTTPPPGRIMSLKGS